MGTDILSFFFRVPFFNFYLFFFSFSEMKPKTALLAVVIVFLVQEAFSTRLNLIKTMIRNKRTADDCEIAGGVASHCTSLGAARAHFLSHELNSVGPGKKRSSLNLPKLQRMKTSGQSNSTLLRRMKTRA